MGKLSSILMVFVFVNVIGYLLMSAAIEEGFATSNPYVGDDTILGQLYTPYASGDGGTVYLIGNNSAAYGSVPTGTPGSFIQQGVTFIDRIFVIFDFIKTLLAVLLFPVALVTFMGLPYQLSMLIMAPLTLLYIIGFFDLISGGSN